MGGRFEDGVEGRQQRQLVSASWNLESESGRSPLLFQGAIPFVELAPSGAPHIRTPFTGLDTWVERQKEHTHAARSHCMHVPAAVSAVSPAQLTPAPSFLK